MYTCSNTCTVTNYVLDLFDLISIQKKGKMDFKLKYVALEDVFPGK